MARFISLSHAGVSRKHTREMRQNAILGMSRGIKTQEKHFSDFGTSIYFSKSGGGAKIRPSKKGDELPGAGARPVSGRRLLKITLQDSKRSLGQATQAAAAPRRMPE